MEGILMLRYMFLMMGFFSMFCGLIYNEFFAMKIKFLLSDLVLNTDMLEEQMPSLLKLQLVQI